MMYSTDVSLSAHHFYIKILIWQKSDAIYLNLVRYLVEN